MKKRDKLADPRKLLLSGYSVINVSDRFNDLKRVPLPDSDRIDTFAWEHFFHGLPQDELEVFVCLYLGMTSKEIVEALQYNKISYFYKVNWRLKNSYQKQKTAEFFI